MRIVHRISIAATPEVRAELAMLGVVVGTSGMVTFEVDESHEKWPDLKEWTLKRRAVDITRTHFSKKEVDEARWLVWVPDWHHGYPQPDDGASGYLDATYELADACAQCGIGLKQKAPFRMKAEPRWGRKGVLQLNWVFDEFFVRPDVWETIFKPRGVACRPVIDAKGAELKTVVQLVAEEEVGVAVEGLSAETCEV